jgi:hypothetical protein
VIFMVLGNVLISPDIRANLGPEGVAELTASLWPVDCQTCGRPLGMLPPALAVDDATAFAWASLHHKQCRAPGWNSGPVIIQTAAGVSHRSRLIIMPTQKSRRAARPDGAMPMMVVNPGMESVTLRRDRGRWRPQFDSVFTDAGMVPPGRKLRIRRPIRGATATLTPATARITLHDLPDDVYESDIGAENAADDPFRREITSQGGIMLAVTHIVDPAADDGLGREIASAMREGRMLCGWVALRPEP